MMIPLLAAFTVLAAGCLPSSRTIPPASGRALLVAEGVASYYADSFEGRRTASGDMFTQQEHTAAHRSFPFGTVLRVINLKNSLETTVRVNDRGPAKESRLIDLSRSAAEEIGMVRDGVANVRIEVIAWGDGRN